MKYIIQHEISIEIPDDFRELDNKEIVQVGDMYVDHDYQTLNHVHKNMIHWHGFPYIKGLSHPVYRRKLL